MQNTMVGGRMEYALWGKKLSWREKKKNVKNLKKKTAILFFKCVFLV